MYNKTIVINTPQISFAIPIQYYLESKYSKWASLGRYIIIHDTQYLQINFLLKVSIFQRIMAVLYHVQLVCAYMHTQALTGNSEVLRIILDHGFVNGQVSVGNFLLHFDPSLVEPLDQFCQVTGHLGTQLGEGDRKGGRRREREGGREVEGVKERGRRRGRREGKGGRERVQEEKELVYYSFRAV